MNIKNFKRMLAIVMTLVCVFAYVVFEPASALAENAREEKQLTENINEINSIWESCRGSLQERYFHCVHLLLSA